MKVKEKSEKAGLKFNAHKMRIMASGPITSWQIDGETMTDFISLGSKMGKEYVKAVCCHLAYSIYMQSTSCETSGWMKHKQELRLPGEISITSDMQMTPL